MTGVLRLTAVDPVIHGVLRLVWDDGYEGVLDLRPVIARGKILAPLQDAVLFAKVQLDPHGHSISWRGPDGEEIDFGADGLRTDTEKQAKLHELVGH
jgi:hypothetical protein